MNYSVQMTSDEFTDNEEEKCYKCSGKFICVTVCCNKKICEFHRTYGKEDGKIFECEFCIENENVVPEGIEGTAGHVQKNGLIYCKKHFTDQLKYCQDCKLYYCEKHFNEVIEYSNNIAMCKHGWINDEVIKFSKN